MHSESLTRWAKTMLNSRRARWLEQEWRETMFVPRRESAPVVEPEPEPEQEQEQEQPYIIGDAVMAAAILAAIAGILSYGPWL